MTNLLKPTAFLLCVLLSYLPAYAHSHDEMLVKFHDYDDKSIKLAKKSDKPLFMLFSAEWCYWCKAFEEEALQDDQVYRYLNKYYINIFVDADIRNDLLMTFGVTLLPYIVFLNPDGSIYSKYGGTLGAEDFYELLQTLRKDIKSGKSPMKAEKWSGKYDPPTQLDIEKLESLRKDFVDTALDSFDQDEYGFGSGSKTFMPNTFLYLMGNEDSAIQEESVDFGKSTMEKAIDTIYDPLEGGFFRYAEKRSWRIPHYEKMVDINAAAILMALKINAASPSTKLRNATKNTMAYLSTQLFDKGTGSFLSFQDADGYYYRLDKEKRKKADRPSIARKIFSNRLAIALTYFLEAYPYIEDRAFKEKIKSSVDFLASMASGKIYHYYAVDESKWSVDGKLSNYANMALLFSKAYTVYKDEKYLNLTKKILSDTSKRFLNKKTKIFSENPLITMGEIEKLLQLNAAIILAWQETPELKPDARQKEMIEAVMTYFSGLGEILSEKAWGAKDLRFLEKYGRFLTAVDNYLAQNVK